MKRIVSLLTAGLVLVLAARGSAQPEWTTDLGKMKIPDAPASGKVLGQDFSVDKVEWKTTHLELRKGKDFFPDAALLIFLFLKKDESIEGKTYEVAADGKFAVGTPHVHAQAKLPGEKLPKTQAFSARYAMKLEFGKAKDGKIPGKIYVCLPDDTKTVVAGKFDVPVK